MPSDTLNPDGSPDIPPTHPDDANDFDAPTSVDPAGPAVARFVAAADTDTDVPFNGEIVLVHSAGVVSGVFIGDGEEVIDDLADDRAFVSQAQVSDLTDALEALDTRVEALETP